MPRAVTPARLAAFDLFADLDEHALARLTPGLTSHAVGRGSYLYRQGREADSAFFLESGTLEVLSVLPGGDEVVVTELGPGQMLGETSLVRAAQRTASVRARTDAAGLVMHSLFFRSAVAQLSASAFVILRQLLRVSCTRLRRLYAQMVELERSGRMSTENRLGADFLPAPAACAPPELDYRPYLSLLRVFSGFAKEQIDELEGRMIAREIGRGHWLYARGEEATTCYFVVRGAIETCILRDGERVPLAVVGPGGFVGATEVVTREPRLVHACTRESVTVLELPGARLHELLEENSWLALRFQLALVDAMILDLGKLNRRLARIVSHASIHARKRIECLSEGSLDDLAGDPAQLAQLSR